MSDQQLDVLLMRLKSGEYDGVHIAAAITALNELTQVIAERDALRLKLIETAQELHCMIDMANAKLEQDICSTDDTPPDYFDAQTVHEAMMLANKLEGKGDE